MLRPGLTIHNSLRRRSLEEEEESSHKCIKYYQSENSPDGRLPVTEKNTNIRQNILVLKVG